jgi:hypothetical protein
MVTFVDMVINIQVSKCTEFLDKLNNYQLLMNTFTVETVNAYGNTGTFHHED